MDFLKLYEKCELCPRRCKINRREHASNGRHGFCNMEYSPRVAYIGIHMGEEPPISGTRGSGTVFFSGCSLKCSYCQNYQISNEGLGTTISLDDMLKRILDLIIEKEVHNINMVTPDHFFPHTFLLVKRLREEGHDIPIVYNLSGYQSMYMLGIAEDYADIYLPDFKYSDEGLSENLSRCKDYPRTSLTAIAEMVRQKGFLNFFNNGDEVARRGVLVRHLILPGFIDNSLNALDSLFLEFGADLPLSIMSQYYPVLKHEDRRLNRPISHEEFSRVYAHAEDLGFENLFVQFPDRDTEGINKRPGFLPDFRNRDPFPGNSPGY